MRAVVVIGLFAGVAEAAPPGPVASLHQDIDGNGSPDTVELTADGILHIQDPSRTDVRIAASASVAKIAVARGAGSPLLVVDVTAGQTREGVVLDRTRGWHLVTRFALGGVGLDREYGIEIEASPYGVVRYQSRYDVQRCDGAPAYLFGERLDGAAFRKLDKLPTRVPPNAQTLTARIDHGPAPQPLVFQAKAASHQAGASNAGELGIPRELDDGRIDTQWREDLASGGEGQFFTFKARVDKQAARQLRIVPGDPTSAARMRAVGRPHWLAIVSEHGAWRVELPGAANEPLGAAYVVDLPPATGDCVTVVIESVQGRGPTSIAELGVYAEGERTTGGEVALARIVAIGDGDTTGAAAALARRGAAAVAAIDAELAATSDAGARRRLVKALAKIVDPAAATSLARAATEGWVRDRDLLDVIGALAANGQITALRDLAGQGGIPIDARVAAAQALRPIGPGMAALVELAGRGPRELRKTVIDRLAAAPVDQLVQAATAQTAPPTAGDLWRAATRAARTQQGQRVALVAAMLAALPSATDYERRYRLIDGIATHGDAAALATLAQTLSALPADAATAALRQVAIHGLASAPRPEGAALLIAAARDPDPGVRLAALGALAVTDTDPSGPWHHGTGPDGIDRVIISAMSDPWPDVRRRAASSLGNRCQRPGPAKVLFEAVSRDRTLEVRQDALVALVQCAASGVHELLPFLWNSSKHPIELREHAIGLVVQLDDHQLATTLVKRFARWRSEAIESGDALTLAKAAAATLGLMRPPGAAKVLLDALDDSAFPELVAAAALALGELGPACPAAARAKLAKLASSDDQASVPAKRALGRCGK